MPIPQPKGPENITVKGSPAKKLISVAKPYKGDHPDIMDKLVELADQTASENKS